MRGMFGLYGYQTVRIVFGYGYADGSVTVCAVSDIGNGTVPRTDTHADTVPPVPDDGNDGYGYANQQYRHTSIQLLIYNTAAYQISFTATASAYSNGV